jgi:hypothetical protein
MQQGGVPQGKSSQQQHCVNDDGDVTWRSNKAPSSLHRTTISGNDQFSLKPYMFTPAIFKEKFGRSIKAWGYHGFLPKNTTSAAQNAIKKQGDTMRNYHKELEAVLTTFRESGPRLKGIINSTSFSIL